MAFSSLAEALAMAGHGPYVWSAYTLTALVVVALVIAPSRRTRRSRAQIQAEIQRLSAASAATESQEANRASYS